ncbi:hypothetical protein J2T57_001274 [Natronocella acetinitrilica]|uniref:Uncharacterized protein n=1 Tax=Natronocella acetinitrilica TaxID=414046 RepID=A0AAE3G5D9_9GAMM|nr:hypothetical protein [Natronocella acetinitrilica]MCP1674172.1 hypothetical protein [Natronocella acetinitrilica]
MIDGTTLDIDEQPGVFHVMPRPVPVLAEVGAHRVTIRRIFAPEDWQRQAPGVPIRLPSVPDGEPLAINRGLFDALYVPLGETRAGEGGVYCRARRAMAAVELSGCATIEEPESGQLSRALPGDFLVRTESGVNRLVRREHFPRDFIPAAEGLAALSFVAQEEPGAEPVRRP